MNKTLLTIALLASGITVQTAHAQLAAKKGITIEEIYKEINNLAEKGDDASKKQLLFEANAFAKSNTEKYVTLGASLYEFIEQPDLAKRTNASILKKFPKGLKARSEAFDAIFKKENQQAADLEKQYTAFVKKFPEQTFDEKERNVYTSGIAKIALQYFKENNVSKANQLVESIKSKSNFAESAYMLGLELNKLGDYKNSLPILENLYAQSQDKKSVAARYATVAPTLLAKALIQEGNADKGVKIIEDLLASNANASSNTNTILTLADAYSKQGKDLNAFLALEKLALKNGKSTDIVSAMTPLYTRLNNGKSDINDYLTGLDKSIAEANLNKYKAEMIKEAAPDFSLVNLEGKTVTLSELKGKVVVLDFWATWCGPCKISFPGMQAAVNKYKDDKEVEFLFIDTWQREENYEQLVREFIAENKYTFNVLFDEMKDRTKATTTAYGVKGIPNKVVIDKEGNIRFKSSGGTADVEKIVNEMTTKIELARKG